MRNTLICIILLFSISLYGQKKVNKKTIKGTWITLVTDSLQIEEFSQVNQVLLYKVTDPINNSYSTLSRAHYGEDLWIYRFVFDKKGVLNVIKEKIETHVLSDKCTHIIKGEPIYIYVGEWHLKEGLIQIRILNQSVSFNVYIEEEKTSMKLKTMPNKK